MQVKTSSSGRGAFIIETGNERLAEMAFGIDGSTITVFHTEVADSLKGQGIAQRLLDKLEEYALANSLKVVPLCPYVKLQFDRNPARFDAIRKTSQ